MPDSLCCSCGRGAGICCICYGKGNRECSCCSDLHCNDRDRVCSFNKKIPRRRNFSQLCGIWNCLRVFDLDVWCLRIVSILKIYENRKIFHINQDMIFEAVCFLIFLFGNHCREICLKFVCLTLEYLSIVLLVHT